MEETSNSGQQQTTTNSTENSENSVGKVDSSLLARNKSQANLRLWQPGQSGNPAGRPKKAVEQAYLDAVKRAMTPERVHDLIVELADRSEWRAKAFAAELAMHYGAGKPIQRLQNVGESFADVIAMLTSGE